MAKLILSMDGLVLKEIPLVKERTSIGRKPHNDIQIDNLAVSGEHAVIVTILNDCFLEDLGSTNGTLVNGNPVKKHFLQNNDVVELGKYRLKFIADAPVPAAAPVDRADFEKTMVLRPSAMRAAADQAKAMGAGGADAARASAAQHAAASAASAGTADRAPVGATTTTPIPARAAAPAVPAADSTTPTLTPTPAPAAAAPAATQAATATSPGAPAAAARPGQPLGAIQILSGANAGKELELAKPLTTLGKPGVQVAVLTRRPQGYFITHVEGANPPSVNGQSIGTAPHSLKDHDVIELAGVKMEFFLKG
jgi:pSer/pThr/pTyr-binding forkhead associated (FHA) protein